MSSAEFVRTLLLFGLFLGGPAVAQEEAPFYRSTGTVRDYVPVIDWPNSETSWDTTKEALTKEALTKEALTKEALTKEVPTEEALTRGIPAEKIGDQETDQPKELLGNENDDDNDSNNEAQQALAKRDTRLMDRDTRLAELKKLRRIETMLADVIPKVTPCVVSIGETASGVIVKPSGIVITASHVTRKAGRMLDIRLHDGRSVKGISLGSNEANDTSAIKLLGSGPWPYLKTVSPDYTAQAGQWCVAFGYPLSWPRDKPSSARIGRVTGQYRGKMVTDCPIMGGDSGGALVDLDGNLLGINSSVRLDVTQNLHVPIIRYRDDWAYMMSNQDVDVVTAKIANAESNANAGSQTGGSPTPNGKPYLGIYGESIPNGVRIRDIRRNSPAEKAALLPEDVIWQIDDTATGSFAGLLKYLATKKGGDQITVRVNRFGTNLSFVVTLAQR